MKQIKERYRSLSDDNKLLVSLIISLFIIWIIFDAIKFNWANDPFQKVILAPLGEEPFKLLLAFLLISVIPLENYFIRRYSKRRIASTNQRRNKIKNLTFSTMFSYGFVPFSVVAAASFGFGEGSFRNIVLHISLSSLAAILFIVVYKMVRDKHWRLRFKLIAVLSTISIPMILHSISNQYSNGLHSYQ